MVGLDEKLRAILRHWAVDDAALLQDGEREDVEREDVERLLESIRKLGEWAGPGREGDDRARGL